MIVDAWDCVILYVGDALLLLFFAAAIFDAIGYTATRLKRRYALLVTHEQLQVFLWLQLGIVLLALLGFKFVVLSGGPGIISHEILSHGTFTRIFSESAIYAAYIMSIYGATRWFKFGHKLYRRMKP